MPKTKMVFLSDYENAILRYLAERIQSYIDTDDLVLFVGNSGRYVIGFSLIECVTKDSHSVT